MKHTIEILRDKTPFLDDNKKIQWTQGYAFMDESGHCIIIVYGEGKRDAMSKYLDSDEDPLGLKYTIINL
jgi:6-phosphogluconolactonase/glucosamine-6-phosphate isomerase/deaminase